MKIEVIRKWIWATAATALVLAQTWAQPVIREEYGAGDLERDMGRTASLIVYFEAIGPFELEWRKDGVLISTNGAFFNTQHGKAAFFTIDNVQKEDEGLYTVRISSPEGSVTSSNLPLK